MSKLNGNATVTPSPTPGTLLSAQSGKFRGYALVRDANGKPLIDDPHSCPKQIKDLLTDDEYFDIYHIKRI